jgi:hypothetical protein
MSIAQGVSIQRCLLPSLPDAHLSSSAWKVGHSQNGNLYGNHPLQLAAYSILEEDPSSPLQYPTTCPAGPQRLVSFLILVTTTTTTTTTSRFS